MRSIPGGYFLYKFDELSNSAKSQAIEQSEDELFVIAVTSLKTQDYLDPKKQILESKGFSNIKFYRFFVEEKHIRIDFTFDYIITEETFSVFKKFADNINLKIYPNFSNWVRDGLLEVIIKSSVYENVENKKSNITIEKVAASENYGINEFIDELLNTYVSFYEYILNSLYVKIRRDIKRKTNREAFDLFIQNNEFYANGLLYEES